MSNLVSFFKDFSKIIVISDVEGYDFLQEPSDSTNNKLGLIVVGDLIDSTFVPKLEPSADYLEKKSNNLKNLEKAKNKNTKVILGNRDINKIKCKFLLELNNPQKQQLVTDFNNGKIDLSVQTYKNICEEFKLCCKSSTDTNLIKYNPWKINRMSKWFPFWNTNAVPKNLNVWTKEEPYAKIFKERFDEIFGIDGSVGTMSAQNMALTIYEEIFGGKYPINCDKKDIDIDDFKCFCTLAVFRSMTIKSEVPCKKQENCSCKYRELLVHLFENGIFCGYYELPDKLLLFSHGGITNSFVNNTKYTGFDYKIVDEAESMLPLSLNFFKTNKDAFTSATNIKTGGYHNTNKSEPNDLIKIKQSIDYTNKFIHECVLRILKEPTMDVPNEDMLFVLAVSAPFDCTKYSEILSNQFKLDCSRIVPTIKYSPIVPGLYNLREDILFCSTRDVYQFLGHIPVGFAPTIDLVENKKKAITICLDTSNTFLGTQSNKIIPDMRSRAIIEKNEIYVDVNVNIIEVPPMTFTKYNLEELKKYDGNSSHMYISEKLLPTTEIKLNYKCKINNEIFQKIKLSSDNKISYHGNYKKDNIDYNVCTYNGNLFNKCLLIITDNELKSILNVQKGGSNDIYYRKYLKYKTKYLQAKKA